MENSLRDLLDQLEWTNFSRVSTKDSVEKFEQVQILYCFIQLSFHYSHRAKEGRNNEWKFPFQTRLEEIRISIDRKKLQLLRTTNGKFSSLFFRMDNLNGQIFAKFRSTKEEKFCGKIRCPFCSFNVHYSSPLIERKNEGIRSEIPFSNTHIYIYISQDFNDTLIKKRNNTNTKLAPPFSSFPKEEPSPEVERSWKIPSTWRKF